MKLFSKRDRRVHGVCFFLVQQKLSGANFDDLALYPRANANAFPELVDKLMGF